MSSTKDDLITLRLSTAQFAKRDAVEAFRETFGFSISDPAKTLHPRGCCTRYERTAHAHGLGDLMI